MMTMVRRVAFVRNHLEFLGRGSSDIIDPIVARLPRLTNLGESS